MKVELGRKASYTVCGGEVEFGRKASYTMYVEEEVELYRKA